MIQVKYVDINNQVVRGVAYPTSANLIPLGHILNATINIKNGDKHISDALRRLVVSLNSIEASGLPLPGVDDLDGVAISRVYGHAELLPPFQANGNETVREIYSRIGNDILQNAQSDAEVERLVKCLSDAQGILDK